MGLGQLGIVLRLDQLPDLFHRGAGHLLQCHADVFVKVDRVGDVIAIEGPQPVLFLRKRAALKLVAEFAEAPGAANKVLGAGPGQCRPLAVAIEIDLDLPLPNQIGCW